MPQNTPLPVVECDVLTKVFQDFWGRGRVLAVDQLDLAIQPGEVFGLLGPNGSGKSTTIKMLLGLLYPTRGRARVFGRPPTDTSIKARIGYLPEESYLYKFLDAYETLDYFGRLFKLDRTERRRRIEQLIDMVGLKRAAHRAVGQYSKGMARRIGLAQALINDPDLLILDEPTSGLDPIGSRQIKDVISALAKRGKTVLLSSHLLADVEDVCDRAVIMYGGRVQASGTIHELLSRREVTQITLTPPDAPALAEIERFIETRTGRPALSVDHPTDKLEDLFLRVVEKAQREQLATSGAESGRAISQFLAAPEGAERQRPQKVLEELVAAGTRETPEPKGETPTPPTAPSTKFDVLEELTADDDVPEMASEPGRAGGEGKARAKPNRVILEKLTQDEDQSS